VLAKTIVVLAPPKVSPAIPETNLRAILLAPAVASPRVRAAALLERDNVPVKPVQLTDLATAEAAEVVTVTVPEAPSKNTSSAAVGTAAPPAPPDVVAHLVPAVPSHVALPPTQNLFATITS
jgi:hypothetical protein